MALDHYIWVEFLPSYPDPPDLFYKLRVSDICRVRIPERFIVRSGLTVSVPTRVSPKECGPDDVNFADMVADEDYVTFFVVHFTDSDVPDGPIMRTIC